MRGVKGSKVLRTRKIKINNWNRNTPWSLYCSQGCYNDFFKSTLMKSLPLHRGPSALKHRLKILERTKHENPYYNWYDTKIEVDETRQS